MKEETFLRFHFENKKPIELIDFTNALVSVQNEYEQFALSKGVGKVDAKLYVEKVKEGSIIVDLAAHTCEALLPMMADVVTITEFAKVIKTVFEYFLGVGERPEYLTKSMCQIASDIVNSTAKDSQATLIIQLRQGATINGNVNMCIATEQATATQNQSRVEQENIENRKQEYEEEEFKSVLLQITQLNSNKSADRGKVEKIDRRKEYKLLFIDVDKSLFTEGENNPLNRLYFVDIRAHRIGGKIKAYEVLRVHEAFEE